MTDNETNDNYEDDLKSVDERSRTAMIGEKLYTIRCTDPFGLWHIVNKKGSLPEELKGSFTGVEQAWTQIRAYENRKQTEKDKKKEPTIISTDGKGGRTRVPRSTLFPDV